MHFELLQSISLNGTSDRPNDDRCGSTTQLAWIIDGATDLGEPGLLGCQGGAAWLASTANTAFASACSDDLQSTCRAVFKAIETEFARQSTRPVRAAWEMPKAAFSAAQLFEDRLSIAWASDCPVLLISGAEVHWCTGTPDTSDEMADALAFGAIKKDTAVPLMSDALIRNRQAHRAQTDHIALSPDATASATATNYASASVSIGDELILMSDGFSSLITDYKQYTANSLVDRVRTHGLGYLAQEIRGIEAEDAACAQFPRFKVSDDATALWLKVSG